jgi:hypothetical protein
MRTPRGYLVLLSKFLLFLSVVVLMLSIGGYIASQVRNAASTATFDPNSVSGYRAYGEVPIPGTQTLHLPAGKVAITFHAETVGVPEAGLPIPDLKLDINAPEGVADPAVTESAGGTTSFNNDAWRQVWIAEIQQAGDYQIATDGQVTAFVSAHLAFGYADFSPSRSSSPANKLLQASQIAFGAAILTLVASLVAVRRLSGDTGQYESEAGLLATGQRVPGILNSYRDTGRTLRSSGKASIRPEFLDDPLYALDVELQLPDRAPLHGRSIQRVPRTQVPTLVVGRQLMCVADAAKPSRRFVVDWGDIPPESVNSGFSENVSAEPAPPAAGIARRLQELETLRASGAISDTEYAAKRQQIIADI